MHVQRFPNFTQLGQNFAFQNVIPQRNECGGAVIDNERHIVLQKGVEERIKPAFINSASAQQLQKLYRKLFILSQRMVHRVGVDALDLMPTVEEVLSKDASDKAFPYATLALK